MKRFIPSFIFLCAALASSSASALSDKEKFKLCESESFMALNMGRNYIVLSKGDKSSVLNYVSDDFGRRLANELFEGVAEGRIKHYADFAADQLLTCSRREAMPPLEKTRNELRLCFARVDIPFFLTSFRDTGMSSQAAVERVQGILRDSSIYPPSLIDLVAKLAFPAESAEPTDRLMKRTFWACTFSEEWTSK